MPMDRFTQEALLIESITQAVREGQSAHRHYSSDRIGTCPPSQEYPVERTGGGWQANRNAQLERWREKYPDLTEETFTHPRVRAVLVEAGLMEPREPYADDERHG